MSEIARFISGDAPDKLGRNIEQLLAYNHFWLEHDHKYIQVLFPIDEGTKFNKHAPLVTQEDREVFSQSEDLRAAHLKVLDLLLEFWGLRRDGCEISSMLALSPANHVWLKSHDHNQLRLTRAIRSLYLLGNEQVAVKLCNFLIAAANETGMVSDKTVEYWRNAVKG
ncbi:opioid growth factor receptor-related protein [Vibrio methylphosphonaticus]|uniref:opioid growth factor receptor-related protein n=1 Tax=Vibrio methylphosphonaticus TaxID=2946866 RepID=UPI00202A9A3A|nr:opioid growth factor receptor-related protein [Vibrio methylphosphonaticus]MCL9777176.1 opioid growth factor receptor-related protein [Vibrio methylphosphonaticus]